MALDTPILRVSRPVAACTRCRNAKTRCDGKLPACSSCEKAGKSAECSSSNDQFARGKERSYPAFLESRLVRLQRKLAEARKASGESPDLASISTPVTPPSSKGDSFSSVGGLSNSKIAAIERARETNDVDELVSSFGVLSVNAAARDYEGFTSLMSVVRVMLWAASSELSLEPSSHPLPPKSEAALLGLEYLNDTLLVFPVIEESTFWTSLEAVYMPGGGVATPWNHWILRLVLANALLVKSTVYGDEWHRLARLHVTSALPYAEVALRPDTIPSIQAMLLLVEYSRYDPRAYNHWTLVGAVSRAIVDLGLHQDPPHSANVSRNKLETRRRLFLCVYSADRTTSIPMDRAFTFSEASTNVDVAASLLAPQGRQVSQEAQIWLKPYEYSFRYYQVRRIQSQVYQDMHQSGRAPWTDPYSYVWSKWNDIYEWQLGISPGTPRVLERLAVAETLASYIMLLAPSPRIPVICELAQNLLFEYCIEYGGQVHTALEGPSLSWMSYTSFLRVRKIAHIFLDNIQTHRERLLAGIPPRAETSGPSMIKLPPQMSYQLRDNIERSLTCIHHFSDILKKFGVRMGIHQLAESFQIESGPFLDTLV